MITFIHGDDIVSSRNKLMEFKNKTKATTFLADSEDPTVLLQLLQGNNLFEDKKSLIIENLFSKKATLNLKLIESKPKSLSNVDLFVWEGKELTKSQIASLGKSENKLYKIPQQIFFFLDSISPKNLKNAKLFHEALSGVDEEFVFFMLIRQFRLMLALSDRKSEIDEVKRLAPWQKNKLVSQSQKFGTKNLIDAYEKLFDIESRIKVGNLNMPLVHAIDIFLVEI